MTRVIVSGPQQTERHIDIAGGRFAYLGDGPSGDHTPFALCLHGFPDHPYSFVPLMDQLRGANIRCAAPWMRGYAPSVLEGPFHTERLALDVLELADAFSPNGPVIVIGHDWGAVATYEAVARYPDRFACAVTMAVPHPMALASNIRREPEQLRRSWYMLFFQLPILPEHVVSRRNFQFVDWIWRTWSPHYRQSSDERRKLKACFDASMPAPIAYYRAITRPVAEVVTRFREASSLFPVTTPLLNLHGAQDGCIGAGLAADQDRYFHGPFEAVVLSDAGHFLQVERPVSVATKILPFIDSFVRTNN